ncbi:MAG: dienelactone hydrolase family protein [Deltaproteobacteria bacterium]|nr:MAG: dienelactone hydrolase family protein [Deltaproteobacteria bacterium]
MSAGFDVEIPGAVGARAEPAYACLPERPRRGMVIIHELLGRQPEIDRVVERFGRAGYAAVAPDLFAPGFRPACIARAMRAVATGEGAAVDQAIRARDWLTDETGLARESIGIIGFCFGGGFALAVGRHWGAVSTNYGVVPETPLLQGIGPVIGCYGGRDRVFGRNGERLSERLSALGVPHESHTFDAVGHSFLTDGDHPVSSALSRPLLAIRYDPDVAEDGWRRIFAFMERHLPPAAG